MENETNGKNGAGGQDRIAALQQRMIRLKQESRDIQFSAYLDTLWDEVQLAEHSVSRLERLLEQNYQLYQRKMAAQQSVVPQAQPAVTYAQQNVPQQNVSQPQPTAPCAQPIQPQPAAQYTQQPTVPYTQPDVQQNAPQSVEFKVGTVILSVLGIAFLLIAFVTFGLNYLSSALQGIFLYGIAAAVLLFSELFLSKRVEKFSYCITGLGISGIYITTILNDRYLKVFPTWAALLVTVAVTAFFFYLSRKKDSGLIRIICLIGCYISLALIPDLESEFSFLLPAAFILLVNLAGVYCPVGKRRLATDVVQYLCSSALIIDLCVLQEAADLPMWMPFILICSQILTLHLLYHRTKEETGYRILYFTIHSVSLLCLLYTGCDTKWMHLSVLGVIVLYAALTALLWKKKIRFAPYLYAALYCILVYLFSGEAFWTTLFCLVVFALNKGLCRSCREFPVPDAVYTMLAAIGVCCFTRSGEAQFLGYVFAATILLSCIFVNKYKKYHIYTSLTFAWLFLLTEGLKPFLCSILICALAAVTIGIGFYIKDKAIRIYGLALMIFVALKLVVYDFYTSPTLMKILVFLIVGLLILGVSFLYIYLEKKQTAQSDAQEETPHEEML